MKHQTLNTKLQRNPNFQKPPGLVLKFWSFFGFLVRKSLRNVSQVSHDRHVDNPFPLTPVLSPGERETRNSALAVEGSCGLAKNWSTILPLPRGEGRGEGERCERIWDRAHRAVGVKSRFQISLARVWRLGFGASVRLLSHHEMHIPRRFHA